MAQPVAVPAQRWLALADHWVRSPLLNINRSCQTCHRAAESELQARVDVIQERNHKLLERGGVAIVDLIDAIVASKKGGASESQLQPALALQRRAQWRLDFIAAENSMGFHAPQEAARVLAEAIDYARQGQLAALMPQGGVANGLAQPAAAAAPIVPPSVTTPH